MLERVESLDSSRYLKESAARNIITTRREELAETYGTASRAGNRLLDWKPYHVEENFQVTAVLKTLFSAAQPYYPELKPTDLPAMQIAASLFYPDFDDLYYVDPEFIKKQMKRTGAFSQRDYAMIPGLIKAASLKSTIDEPLGLPQIEIGSEFETHQKLFADAMGSFKSNPDTMSSIVLLAVERLVENDAIKTVDGRLPRTLSEVIDPETRHESRILHTHAMKQEEFFKRDYQQQLPTSEEVLPFFAANKEHFFETCMPLLTADTVDLPTLFYTSWNFSQSLKKEKALRSKK